MKLVFTKLETPATEIKVAFDGVNYKSYNVDEIKTNGYIQFTEEECPDLTKIKVNGKFKSLTNVEVSVEASANSNVVIEKPSITIKEMNPENDYNKSGLTLYNFRKIAENVKPIGFSIRFDESSGITYLEQFIDNCGFNPFEGIESDEVQLIGFKGISVTPGEGQSNPCHEFHFNLKSGDFYVGWHTSRDGYTDKNPTYEMIFSVTPSIACSALYFNNTIVNG